MNGKDIKKIFGLSVKEHRVAKGLTREQLAELIDKDLSTVNRIETGVNFVNSDTLAKLCEVFEVTPAVLLSPPQLLLKDQSESIEVITQLLQTVPANNLKDIYKMLLLLSKYFT